MAKSYIFGAGGHARVVASFLSGEVIFVVSGLSESADQITEDDFYATTRATSDDVFIGIGSNVVRTKIYMSLTRRGIVPAVCVAPNAFIARDAILGPGAVICAGAVVGSRAQIGANTIINTLSSVDHDCVLGDHSQVTAGVTLGGGVDVGRACFFGIKSAVIPGIKIGDGVEVMAGSLVTKNVGSSVKVGGSPARVMADLS